jgi:hypothetical protein
MARFSVRGILTNDKTPGQRAILEGVRLALTVKRGES